MPLLIPAPKRWNGDTKDLGGFADGQELILVITTPGGVMAITGYFGHT